MNSTLETVNNENSRDNKTNANNKKKCPKATEHLKKWGGGVISVGKRKR